MFELPMIRFDEKVYLERLQRGEFFMRSSLYYQSLDGKDTARSDPFDGAIPSNTLIDFPFSESGVSDIYNPRIMMGHTFIKSFFYYDKTDCHKIQDEIYLLSMKTAAKKALAEFSASYALIILNPSQLVEQVSYTCKKHALKLWYSEVEYLSSQELHKREIEFINGHSNIHPVFCKNENFNRNKNFVFV